MNYFSEYASKKYPAVPISVSISQHSTFVKMKIETPEGYKDEIERTFEEFGRVATGQIDPEKVLANEKDVLDLKANLLGAYARIRSMEMLQSFLNSENKSKDALIRDLMETLRSATQKPVNISVSPTLIQNQNVNVSLLPVSEAALEAIDKLRHELAEARSEELEEIRNLIVEIRNGTDPGQPKTGNKLKVFLDDLQNPDSKLRKWIGLARNVAAVLQKVYKVYSSLAKAYGWPEIEIPIPEDIAGGEDALA